MKLFALLRNVTSVVFVSALSSAFAAPHLAFLARPAHSVKGLVSEVRADESTLSSYANHFELARREIVPYLQSLHVEALPKSGVYPIYSSLDPWAKPEAVTLDAGESVFAEASGRVVLRASDGAPLAGAAIRSSVFDGAASGDSTTASAAAPASGLAGAAVSSAGSEPALGMDPLASANDPAPFESAVADDSQAAPDGYVSAAVDPVATELGDDSLEDPSLDTPYAEASTDVPNVADFSDPEPALEFQTGPPPAAPAGAALGVTEFGAFAALAVATVIVMDNNGGSHNPNSHPLTTPEPNSALVIGGGLAILAIRRRRRP